MLRWRIRLYLRPGPGYANILGAADPLVPAAGGVDRRPGPAVIALVVSADMPVTSYGVRLGRAHFGRRVIAEHGRPDPPGRPAAEGKSGWLADRIIDHPGAVMTTTTRTDLYENTAPLRGQAGALHVFNPEGIGGLASTFRWNPLQGCEQPAIALQRAVAFTAATESKGLHDMTFWIGKASSVLASLLHAAALDGRTMATSTSGLTASTTQRPERILTAHPGASRRLARTDPGSPQARPDRGLDPDDRDPRPGLARRPRRRPKRPRRARTRALTSPSSCPGATPST